FPDGTTKEVKNWKDLLVEVARWALPKLEQQGKLPFGKLIARNGDKMTKPKKLDGWFVETNFSAKNCIHNAVRILEKLEENLPSSVLIEGWQPSGQGWKQKRG
ncbi:MAG: hypothetical protein RMK89_14095, partial [Armatimonadota bacterium]|nr:hypothetical protein [Armatimonadota bacterium]MDW8144575.1 hypothetical protein [Armatimonadota bacterium]